MYKHLLAVALIAIATSSQAQVRVVESSPQSGRSGVGTLPLEPAGGAQTDVFSEIQALKFEIANLRGLVEEQAYELSRLKQLQTDGYVDLDSRISALSGNAAPASGSAGTNPVTPPRASSSSIPASAPVQVALPPANASDAEVYTAAYDLLRQREYDAAIVSLKDYLERFPSGSYAGNSYYWLGEIYLLKENLGDAQDWFSRLLEKFPNDRKVPDTQFKLGKVYHLQGNNTEARRMLNQAASGNSDAARLARQYLQDNLQ
ncbi:YbgF trimerization domain-containing protein [Cellvibrio polysaccharolyticus]|uniref:Cell division coordinator CpoB n=1 Tax=Cellvibrio polysaccharolyticus TaxID=2082724 RepID=A0A928V1F0_9GAMM|nr:YbgF trimerization domain-containing protein [Cellvibrio polysaccharolyticus]MBE8716978.1 outer membrane protein assembly factor BamD [Cellvibrio polysaccharolyticus]